MSKTFIQAELGFATSQKLADKVITRFFKDLDCEKANLALSLFKEKRHDDLIQLSVNPSEYVSIDSFIRDYQAVNFLSKFPYLETSIDRKQVAFDKWIEAEQLCKETNDRFFSMDDHDILERRSWASYLLTASHKISSILGNLPLVSSLSFSFGPGASSTCTGFSTTIGDKLQSHISLTPGAKTIFNEMAKCHPHLIAAAFDIENIEGPFCPTDEVIYESGNKLVFVPKSAKTDRPICIEPHINIFLQKGYGSFIRSRLQRSGIDLDKQADKNAYFARLGSIDGSYATIDLESASDTVSTALVMNLLPDPWFDALESVRSPMTLLPDGSWRLCEKFSSMGNGFTFELETLIFYALCLSVKEIEQCDGEVMCFGDDIIVPTQIANTVIKLLSYCGFKTNKKKTYIEGPFRESCGKDYFRGFNVRSYFLKDLPTYETDFFKIANGIRHFASRCAYSTHCCDRAFRRSWSLCIGFIRQEYRLFGPKDLGDQVIWNTRACSEGSYITWYWTMQTKILVPVAAKSKLRNFNKATQRAVSLYPGASENLSRRGRSKRFQIRSVTIPGWEWLEGDWV
jgi:hypothetical protein